VPLFSIGVSVSATAGQEPFDASVSLGAASTEQEAIDAAVSLGANTAGQQPTTATVSLGAAVAASKREPFAAAVSLGAAVTEQEAIDAAVLLGAVVLENMDMAMEPINGGLEETTKGLEAVEEIEEQNPTINLIDEDDTVIYLLCLLNESDDKISDDNAEILDNLCKLMRREEAEKEYMCHSLFSRVVEVMFVNL
jgi:hypothetical protein